MFYTNVLLVVTLTLYFFVYRRHQSKPRFIKVIFCLLNLVVVLRVALQFTKREYIELETRRYYWIWYLDTAINLLITVAHWVFAVKYFEVALSTPLFLKQVNNKNDS